MSEQDLPISETSQKGTENNQEQLSTVSVEVESSDSMGLQEELEASLEALEQSDLQGLADWLTASAEQVPDAIFRQSFGAVRARFRELLDREKANALSVFTADGGVEEDFEFTPEQSFLEVREQIRRTKEFLGEHRRKVEKEQEANFLAKKDLVDELKKLISDESDMHRAFERFNQLKAQWSAIGGVPRGKADELYNNWRHFQNAFYQLASIHRDLFQKELEKNLEIKTALLEKVKALHEDTGIKRSVEALHRIQQEWRETGPIPKEQDKVMFQEFKDACQVIYERKVAHFAALKSEQTKNLERKVALCEKMEELAARECESLTQWKPIETEATEIDTAWRKTGRVGKAMNEQIWDRFREARKTVFRKRIALFKDRDNEFNANLKKKIDLCEQAEALKESTDWKETSQKLVRLQQDWKKIGPVGRKRSDEIWKRFRTACDHFFQAREAWQNGREDRDKATIEERKALIEKLKALPTPETIEAGMEQLKSIQDEWNRPMQLSPADRKSLEEEWNKAIDQYYSGLNLDPQKRERMSYKAKLDNLLAGPNALTALRDERTFIGSRLRKLEEEAVQIENNLAFFGNSKGADALRKQYSDKVATLREQIARWEDKRYMLKHTIAALEKKA